MSSSLHWFAGHLEQLYCAVSRPRPVAGGQRATICSVASQTDLSKCSVILSSRTSLGRFPTHRCRVSRTIPPSPPPPTVRLAAALSLPDSSHSHLGDGRERERRRHRRGGGVGGHHCCWINHSRRFHCAEKRFTFTYRGLPSLLVRLFVRSSAPSALDSCTSSLFCVSRSTDPPHHRGARTLK